MKNKKRLLCVILAAVMVFAGALPAYAITGYSEEESDARLAGLAPPALPGGEGSYAPEEDPYIPEEDPYVPPEDGSLGSGDAGGELGALDAGAGALAAATLAKPVLTWDPSVNGLLHWSDDPNAVRYQMSVFIDGADAPIYGPVSIALSEVRSVNIREIIKIHSPTPGVAGVYRVNIRAIDAAGLSSAGTATYTYNPDKAPLPTLLLAPTDLNLDKDGYATWNWPVSHPANVTGYQLAIHGVGNGYISQAILIEDPLQNWFDVEVYLDGVTNVPTGEYYVVVRARDDSPKPVAGVAATSSPYQHVLPQTLEKFPLFPPAEVDLNRSTGVVEWPAVMMGAEGYWLTVHDYDPNTPDVIGNPIELSKTQLSWNGLKAHLKDWPSGNYYVVVQTIASDKTRSDGRVSDEAYPYTDPSNSGGGSSPGTSYNNVYPTGSAPSAPVAPYAIISNPGGYQYENLRFEQKVLTDSADFSAMIAAHHDSAISSFISGSESWATSALWWDLYMMNNSDRLDWQSPVTVYIPVATGINQTSYDYILLHDTGGSIEKVSFTPRAGGVTFTVNSLSPFALLWRPKGGGTTPSDPGSPGDPANPADPGNTGDPNNPDDWGGPGDVGYDSFWNKVESFIRAARRGEYVDVVLPYYVDSVPDGVLEELADSRATLVIESRAGRRYTLYGPNIIESRLRRRTYDLRDLYGLMDLRDKVDWDKVYYDKDPTIIEPDSYEPGPSTGGDGGYRPISSSGYTGNNYNPGTGGGIMLFSNTRMDDPLPDLPALPAVDEPMSGRDRVALGALIAFFALAAALPLAEKGLSARREQLAAEKARRQAARAGQIRPKAAR